MNTTKPRAGSRRELIRLLDDEVRRIVRARDVFCVTRDDSCFGPDEVSHFFRRGYQRIRFDLDNCHLQCQFHNQLHNTDRKPFTKYMTQPFGHKQDIKKLEASRQNHTPLAKPELEQLLSKLRAIAARATQEQEAA